MHELALCEGVVRIVEREAAAHAVRRVKTVRLEVGALACVSAQSLAFCFEAVARGTVAEDASLEILSVPARAWCLGCGETVEIGDRADPCPRCGEHHLCLVGGEELRVKDLEVE